MIVTNSLFQAETPWYRPFNAITKKPYNGQNVITLMLQAEKMQTRDPRWLTFLQAKEKGYKIKKGAHGVKIEFWTLLEKKEENEKTSEDYKTRKKLMKKTYVVFHASQVEGIEEYKSEN